MWLRGLEMRKANKNVTKSMEMMASLDFKEKYIFQGRGIALLHTFVFNSSGPFILGIAEGYNGWIVQ
jgi:hypothetical protein